MTDYLLEDLDTCRVEGKTFEEILPDIQRMVYYYVRIHYEKWKTIMTANLYDIDDIAQDMFVSICNKRDKKGLSNIQRRFIQASKEDLGMKFISNTIGKTVALNSTSLARGFNKKPKPVSIEELSYMYSNASNSDDFVDHLEMLEDRSQDIELKSSYNLFLDSLENYSYSDYFIEKNGSLKTLDVLEVIDMITDKLTITEMTQLVFTTKRVNITYKRMNEIVKEVRALARTSYDDGNCLIELDIKENNNEHRNRVR